MNSWESIRKELNKKTEQTVKHSIEKAEIKHAISMAELEESANKINVEGVLSGRKVLTQLSKNTTE